jgi:hypothetical protein
MNVFMNVFLDYRARLAKDMSRFASWSRRSRQVWYLLLLCWLIASVTSPAQAGLHRSESPVGTLDARDPLVTILYPTESETYAAETTVNFRWTEEDSHPGLDPTDHTAYVTIAGEWYEYINYTPDPEVNSWEWTVPNQETDAGQFHVMVNDQFGNSTLADSPIFAITPIISGFEPESLPLPDRLALPPPHPNPFNPATRIAFDLPAAGQVSVVVHDLQGRRICELYRGQQAAGRYALTWQGQDSDGRRVAGGVYLVRLVYAGERGHQSLTRKVVLLP